MIIRRSGAVAVAVLLTVVAGCSQSDGRQAVTGSVTVDGRPLLTGSISFRPAAGNDAPSSRATVRDGVYTLPAAQGLRPGKYLVTIQAFAETGRTVEDPQAGSRVEIVPLAFRNAGPREVTVSDSAPNRFDFPLTSLPRSK